jgi:hypothetical protein
MVHYILIRENKGITAKTLKNKYPGTLERYKTSLAQTIEFMKWKYKISDIDIRDINPAFITNYDFFLRPVRKCANNTAIKCIKKF